MKDDAFAVFLFDLIVLGRENIMINEEFMNNLYDYLSACSVVHRDALEAICDAKVHEDDIEITFKQEDIGSACTKVSALCNQQLDASKVFDSLGFELSNKIGSMAVGFSTYLTSLEYEMYMLSQMDLSMQLTQ